MSDESGLPGRTEMKALSAWWDRKVGLFAAREDWL